MIERFLRSPLTICLFLIWLSLFIVDNTINGQRGYSLLIVISFVLFSIIYFGLLIYYNYKYPDKKIKFFTYIPYELKEGDEGHQYITYRACRRVYIYYSVAIPIAIVVVTRFKDIEWMPVFVLAGLGVGQYLTFWTEIKKLQD